MLSSIFKSKDSAMRKFFLAPFKIFLLFGFFSLVIFVGMSIFAIRGDWTIGTTFDEWYSNMTGVPATNGMFSATNFKGCWVCSAFASLFDLMSVVGLKIFVFISDIVWTLVVMGLAIWILTKVYSYIKNEQESDFKEILYELTKKLFIIAIIGVAIGYSTPSRLKSMANTIFENTAIPILEMGVGVGTEIIKSPICEKLTYPESEVDGILSPQLKRDLLCLTNSVNVVFLSATTAGANMIDFSLKNFFNNKNPTALLDIIGGMAITTIFFLMYIFIPFTLVNIIFTIGILIALTPVMIAGYAYDETKSFSSTGLTSLFHMAFYIIMYCIFLGIIYSSFIFIGDMYYPAPLDNFTYLFPDFIYSNMVSSQSANIMKNEGFAECFQMANGNVNEIKTCLSKIGIDFNLPSIGDMGGSFFPIFSLGLLSLMIMGNLKTYSGLVGGYMMDVGGAILSLIKTSFAWLFSVSREELGLLKNTINTSKKASLEDIKNSAQSLDEDMAEDNQ